jgi:hypothetical protein
MGKTQASLWGIIKKIKVFESPPRKTLRGGAIDRPRLLLRRVGFPQKTIVT